MEKEIKFLNHAIEQFIIGNYDVAILTSGSAQESFDKIIKEKGMRSPFEIIKNKNADVLNGANDAYNWLKHASVNNKFQMKFWMNEEEEAINMICRAITSYCVLKNEINETHKKYFNYLKDNYPLIYSEFGKYWEINEKQFNDEMKMKTS